MNKRLAVPPTKSALLQVRRQTHFLEQGQEMLEKKRDLLIRLVYEHLAQYRTLRAQAAAELEEAYRWMSIAHMRLGEPLLRQAAIGLKLSLALKIIAKSSVGVEYPVVSAKTLPLQPVGLMWTDVSFDEARQKLQQLTLTLARLGEAENALWRLLAASRKTKKRVNALKYNIIPRYRETIRFIRAALEEDERNSLFQIKRLRER
ncbi:MAG: V-type ATP synthase subunit D [Gammaproteobacteria bacterium]|nr:V-type ATP synthase subunit D [Gammaproteobacteria bacterium]